MGSIVRNSYRGISKYRGSGHGTSMHLPTCGSRRSGIGSYASWIGASTAPKDRTLCKLNRILPTPKRNPYSHEYLCLSFRNQSLFFKSSVGSSCRFFFAAATVLETPADVWLCLDVGPLRLNRQALYAT